MYMKLIIFALVAYALYRMFMNDRNKKNNESKEEKENLVASGAMSKDPVCGAYIETEGSITVRNGNEVTHFCSYDCRDKYVKEQLESQQKLES